MIIYLDTSDLVKLYVLERNTDQINTHVNNTQVVATSIISYAEARAAFARKFREKGLGESEYRKIIRTLDNDWENYFVLNVSEETVKLAGNLCEKYRLRGTMPFTSPVHPFLTRALLEPYIFPALIQS